MIHWPTDAQQTNNMSTTYIEDTFLCKSRRDDELMSEYGDKMKLWLNALRKKKLMKVLWHENVVGEGGRKQGQSSLWHQ